MPPKPFVNEISSPSTYTDTVVCTYYVMLYRFSDNCIQPVDGQIRNGRNTQLIRYVLLQYSCVMTAMPVRNCSFMFKHLKYSTTVRPT